MSDDRLEQLLVQTDVEQLRMLVKHLYGRNEAIDTLITSHLLRQIPTELSQHIQQRIQQLTRGKTFVDWRSVDIVSDAVDQLVADIQQLAQQNPVQALGLMDSLVASHNKLYERTDDSSGILGFSYQQAAKAWLDLAACCRKHGLADRDWVAEIYQRHQHNNYAVWDRLLADSAILLNTDELTTLADKLIVELQRTAEIHRQQPQAFDYLTVQTALLGVAEALQDPNLYAAALTIVSPEPNWMQRCSLIRFCLSIGAATEALAWYQHSTSNADHNLALLDQIYTQLDDTAQLREFRQRRYREHPSFEHLQALLPLVTETEAQKLQEQAAEIALQVVDLAEAMEFLCQLQKYHLAAQRAITEHDGLRHMFYSQLADFAKLFRLNHQPLAAALCYRALLDDILDEGRSNAYSHAARYYQQLVELDTKVRNYQPAIDHADYLDQLRSRHARKRAFWAKV